MADDLCPTIDVRQTKPSNRSSIYSPPDLSAAIVELFLSTILQARIYGRTVGIVSPRRISRSLFASDSLLEKAGFEPSVPRETTKSRRGTGWLTCAGQPARAPRGRSAGRSRRAPPTT